MPKYWGCNSREENPMIKLQDACKKGWIIILVALASSKQPGKLYISISVYSID